MYYIDYHFPGIQKLVQKQNKLYANGKTIRVLLLLVTMIK